MTRVDRAGVKLVAVPYLKLQQGDKLLCVGGEKSVTAAAQSFGDSSKALNKPNLFAIFLGLILGIILGSLPILIPGLSAPLKLGLAGGPLIVAIIVGRWGAEFGLPTYTTTSANLMIREIGLCAFLACVGLGAGQGFIETLTQGGYAWLGYGVASLYLTVKKVFLPPGSSTEELLPVSDGQRIDNNLQPINQLTTWHNVILKGCWCSPWQTWASASATTQCWPS